MHQIFIFFNSNFNYTVIKSKLEGVCIFTFGLLRFFKILKDLQIKNLKTPI